MGREAGQRIHNPLSCSLAFEVVAISIERSVQEDLWTYSRCCCWYLVVDKGSL